MKGISITFDMLMFVLEIIFLIFFSVLLWKAIAANINPDAQISMFNTQLLHAKIEEACMNGESYINDFKFPQPQPSMLLNEFLPTLAIRSAGDPHYLLYYEMFPEGEGIGWELYQDFPNRVFAPFTYPGDLEKISKADFEKELLNHIKNVDEHIREDFNKYYSEDEKKDYIKNSERIILVNNIMLSDYLNAIPTDWEKKSILNEEEGNAGKWEEGVFKFSNYRGLTQLEKSFLKYRPCGDNTLCMKTRDGVYTFPLNCQGIEYIQLDYDARNREKAWGAIAGIAIAAVIAGRVKVLEPKTLMRIIKTLFKAPLAVKLIAGGFTTELLRRAAIWMSANFLLYKNSDFYVTSPCTLNDINIKVGDCECKKMIKYPMYKYVLEDGNMFVKRIGYHYTCLEGKGNDFIDEYNNVKSLEDFGLKNKCIKITIKEKPNAFCWTPNPYKEGFWNLDSRTYAKIIGFFKADPLAIKKNTAVFYNNTLKGLLIKPLKGISFVSKIIDIDWRWPCGFLVPS